MSKEALEGSIAKWSAIVLHMKADEPYRENGLHDCPLCKEYHFVFHPDEEGNKGLKEQPSCRGCPVAERTGQKFCMNSPYDAWGGGDDDDSEEDGETLENAEAMLAFLESLR